MLVNFLFGVCGIDGHYVCLCDNNNACMYCKSFYLETVHAIRSQYDELHACMTLWNTLHTRI